MTFPCRKSAHYNHGVISVIVAFHSTVHDIIYLANVSAIDSDLFALSGAAHIVPQGLCPLVRSDRRDLAEMNALCNLPRIPVTFRSCMRLEHCRGNDVCADTNPVLIDHFR